MYLAVPLLLLASPVPLQAGGVQVHQPKLLNPKIDGKAGQGFDRGDLTPDGRLIVAFRKAYDCQYGRNRSALTVGLVNPDGFDSSGDYLDGFESNGEYAFGESTPTSSGPCAPTEHYFVHWALELEECTAQGGPQDPTCVPISYEDPNQPGVQINVSVKPNPAFPLPNPGGGTWLSVAQRDLPNGNPFPSGVDGSYANDGTYQTYELWMVRANATNHAGNYIPNLSPGGSPLTVPEGLDAGYEWVCQDLTVIIDPTVNEIVDVEIGPFTPILSDDPTPTPSTATQGPTPGIELSMTADGRMITYHGNANDKNFSVGNGKVTYIYNNNGYSATGWSQPRSITEPPHPDDYAGSELQSLDQFKNRYKVFKNPIRLPRVPGELTPHVFAEGDAIRGPYPWISRDGSFFLARSVTSTQGGSDSTPRRSGGYVVGDLTGGYIKHVDDVGINPTRRGGKWYWPRYGNYAQGGLRASWSTIGFSTGLKPGIWEPLMGENVPFPSQDASSRIPVLPFITSINDTYGEVRFEEADGNYLLYLACNEALVREPSSVPGLAPILSYETGATPDTSGRASRSLVQMNPGAAFPHEVTLNSSAGATEDSAYAELRSRVGLALNNVDESGAPRPFHENLGFKGQALTFSPDGLAYPSSPLGFKAGTTGFTVQAFAKRVEAVEGVSGPIGGGSSGGSIPHTRLLVHQFGGASPLELLSVDIEPDGAVEATLYFPIGSNTYQSVRSVPGVFSNTADWYDRTEGWHHVAVTFEITATSPGVSLASLKLYVDGELGPNSTLLGNSFIPSLPSTEQGNWFFGPGSSLGSDPVNKENLVLMMDEIAISDVARTEEELRRDAYVGSTPSEFGPFAGDPADLTMGLDGDEADWPLDPLSVWSQAREDLGRDLFADPILSVADDVSCTTCHDPLRAFTDSPAQFSKAKPSLADTIFNTPSLLNSAFGATKTFEGLAVSLEEQVVIPLTNPNEMGNASLASVVAELNTLPLRAAAFDAAYQLPTDPPVGATEDRLKAALGIYMRSLTNGASNFDQTPAAIGPAAQRGRGLFFGKARCFSCHRGSAFTDESFHNIGTIVNTTEIKGLSAATGRSSEMWKLKTPSLRNVSSTAPYFHDGQKATLLEVIEHYNDPFVSVPSSVARTLDPELRPLGLSGSEMNDLVAFLRQLKGN